MATSVFENIASVVHPRQMTADMLVATGAEHEWCCKLERKVYSGAMLSEKLLAMAELHKADVIVGRFQYSVQLVPI